MEKKEKVFIGNGKTVNLEHGALLKFSLSPQDIEKINNWAKDNNGWCNLSISKRKEVSPKGMTHYGVLDTWKPTPKVFDNGAVPDDQIPKDETVLF